MFTTPFFRTLFAQERHLESHLLIYSRVIALSAIDSDVDMKVFAFELALVPTPMATRDGMMICKAKSKLKNVW